MDMQAIFLPEDDVINLKSDLLRFAVSLNEMHQRHFPANPESSLAQTLSVAEMLSYNLQNKTAEAEALARDLLMWTVRHNNLERHNPFIFAALNIFGSVASLGLGISNRLKINYQNKRIEFLQHENELVLSELRNQLSSINQIMSLVNEHSSNIDQIMEVQHLLATLAYYSSKIDHIRTKISHFIEKSKDYVEAITLATRGVLSPHLLPIKDLTLTLENRREKLGYVPLLDAHKIEFYYSLISVSVENYRIMITIPFDSSDAWQAYKIAPFPTFMTNNSSPVISNLTGHVLISPDRESYTVIKDLDKFTHCSEAMNNKVCTADSFEFHPMSMDSCELGIVLNCSLSHTHEGCLKKIYPFDDNKFNFRLNNGSWVRYDKAGFEVACPDWSTAHSKVFFAADGCTGTSTNYRSKGLTLSSVNGPTLRTSHGQLLLSHHYLSHTKRRWLIV
ncbi:uncharacterized protein LOC135223452 [Macrobrachium nipponense]|uniref:uncharacterized protein LOC135223452 n=1 Tax=Macrobrachium nipponense TaxID=159736 RepID=UPI0030C81EC5